MNRRHFIALLAKTAAVSTVAYSFPSVIRVRNVVRPVVADIGLAYGQNVIYISEGLTFLDSGGNAVIDRVSQVITALESMPIEITNSFVIVPRLQLPSS